MGIAISRLIVLSVLVVGCAGCGAHIELQRDAPDLHERFATSKFYLNVEDDSKSKPDNLDGYLNLAWTDDAKSVEVVAEQLQYLKAALVASGFNFVTTPGESSVLANLKFKSVRFDPIGGWMTDDAKILYSNTSGGEILGTVVADEIWITPTVNMVFEALVEGSRKLWGLESGE